MSNIYAQVDTNKRKSLFIMFAFVAFISFSSFLMVQAFNSNPAFVLFAFIFSLLGSVGSYYYSDKIILSLSNAHAADRSQYFDFYTVTENLCLSQQLPFPKLYVIEDSSMNAFATGRDHHHAVICATTGLLSKLNRTELEGVVAHELSHIKNYDIRLMSLVAVLVGTLTLLADWLIRSSWLGGSRGNNDRDKDQFQTILLIAGFLLTFLGPLIANLIKLAISRRREFMADASAVSITKYPAGLINALKKLDADREPLEAANKATAHLYITNPLKNLHQGIGWFAQLFNTHPPLSDRINALTALSV